MQKKPQKVDCGTQNFNSKCEKEDLLFLLSKFFNSNLCSGKSQYRKTVAKIRNKLFKFVDKGFCEISSKRYAEKTKFENLEFFGDKFLNYKIGEQLLEKCTFFQGNLTEYNILISNRSFSLIFECLQLGEKFKRDEEDELMEGELKLKQKADLIESIVGELKIQKKKFKKKGMKEEAKELSIFLRDFVNFIYHFGIGVYFVSEFISFGCKNSILNINGVEKTKKFMEINDIKDKPCEDSLLDKSILYVIKKETKVGKEIILNDLIKKFRSNQIKVKKKFVEGLLTKHNDLFELEYRLKANLKQQLFSFKLKCEIVLDNEINDFKKDLKQFLIEEDDICKLNKKMKVEMNLKCFDIIIRCFSEDFLVQNNLGKITVKSL